MYNLDPKLVAKIKEAFFTFQWEGSALKAEFKDEDLFVPITYKKDWSVIRKIDAANGVEIHLQVDASPGCALIGAARRSAAAGGRRRMLRIKGLTKRYRTGDIALKGIDLDVPDGQVMALIGPSGAGKSTIIRCINRLVEPTAGSSCSTTLRSPASAARELRRARRRMGMIFQEYALVERLTVMENVLSGRLGYVGFWQSWLRRFPQSDIDEAFRLLDASASTIWPTSAPTNCPAASASASASAAP